MSKTSNNLHFTSKGSRSNPCLVFLHGFCEDLTMWDKVLANGFEAYQRICIDLPGFGQSPIADQCSISQMGAMVLQLLDEQEVEKCFLFGHSMGGYVSLSIAEQAQHRLLGLGLINSHPYADTLKGKMARQKSIEFVQAHGSALYVKQLIPKLFPDSFVRSNRFLMEELSFRANTFPAEGIENGLRAMKERKAQTELLKNLSLPLLCVIGKKDSLLPLEILIDQAQLPAICQVALIQGMGHMGTYENPKIIRKAVLDYLSMISILEN